MIKIHLSLALSRQGGKGDVVSSSHRSCVLWFSIGHRSSTYEYPLLHSIGDHKRVRGLKMKLKGSEFASSCYGDDSCCSFTFISNQMFPAYVSNMPTFYLWWNVCPDNFGFTIHFLHIITFKLRLIISLLWFNLNSSTHKFSVVI